MIKLSGQLAIQTKNGRFGKFNVGYLITDIGEFVVKNAELDQYPEGKYDGEFCVSRITQGSYTTNGRIIFEIRARLDSMTLSGADKLSKEDAKRLAHQEPDPVDEEPRAEKPPVANDPLKDTTPFGTKAGKPKQPKSAPTKESDETLFGILWPLSDVVKLDATVDRLVLRKQADRLDKLGYEFMPLQQEWHQKS